MPNLPKYPTVSNGYLFQKFANVDWKLYGNTGGKHMGVDIGVMSGFPGSPIFAAYHGQVVESGYFEQGGYGRRVVIEHEGGQYQTLYAHLQDGILVKQGDEVAAGQQIGTMGGNVDDKYRGASSGTHLHFEVILPSPVNGSIGTFKGWCVDPFPYLLNRYYQAPINAIKVTSIKGLRIRSEPNVQRDSVGVLLLGDVVNVMEILQDNGSEQWVKLYSLRDEYSALKYGGTPNATLVSPVVPAPYPPAGDAPDDSFAEGYNKAVLQMRSFLDKMNHAS